MVQKNIKVSVITPSYNQGQFIEETIRSVQRQRGVDVEHIIVDGGSTDGTLDILGKYSHLKWISEPDGGQSDALNKGLARATGEIIGWLNSDDLYVENILEEVVAVFQKPTTEWVIGNLTTLYESTDTAVAARSPRIGRPELFENPDIVRQQSTFFRREFLLRAGAWDARYFMTMDFDLWVRLLRIAPPVLVDRQWAIFRIHRFQKTSKKNLLTQLSELTEIMRREGASQRHVRKLRLRRLVLYLKASVKEVLIALRVLDRKYEARPLRLPRSAAK